MKIKELIEQLKTVDPEAEATIAHYNDGEDGGGLAYYEPIEFVEVHDATLNLTSLHLYKRDPKQDILHSKDVKVVVIS